MTILSWINQLFASLLLRFFSGRDIPLDSLALAAAGAHSGSLVVPPRVSKHNFARRLRFLARHPRCESNRELTLRKQRDGRTTRIALANEGIVSSYIKVNYA